METRFLQTFLSVTETGSMAETARRLNITPSAVTQRIRALEAEIGLPLLQRSGQRIEATPAGARSIAQARQMVVLADDMKASQASEGESGLLRVGVIHTALTGLLPDILIRLRRKRPGIDLYLVPGASGDLYTQLSEGELDAAIIVKPHFHLPKALEWMPMHQEALLFIAPKGSADGDPRVMLRSEPFIRYDRNHWGGRAVDRYLRQQRIRPQERYELDSLEAIVVMVSRGLGVSIIPDWPAPWPAGVQLHQAALSDAPLREIGVAWSRTSRWLPLIPAFLNEAAGQNAGS